MAMTAVIRFWNGGPDDGAEREFSDPYSSIIEIHGNEYRETLTDGSVRTGHKVYRYDLMATGGRLTYVYRGEYLDEEVTTMGIRKHGVGEKIIDDDQTDENLSKQATTTDWSDKDEDALHDENKD